MLNARVTTGLFTNMWVMNDLLAGILQIPTCNAFAKCMRQPDKAKGHNRSEPFTWEHSDRPE